ncbi:MAG TPA: IS1634 family transposase [Candidatus Tectomicrobia bacterium]|nr:IS1634 family transposase [Candidatus Tectomicrobia bacterium]
MAPPYRSQTLAHLGLVAGMFDELGIGEVIDRATRHQPETRIGTTGDAVQAMVLNGLGFVTQQRYLVSRFFQDKPTSRLLAPLLIEAQHRNDDALGRALDTLYASGVTERYRLIAATAAERLGLAPQGLHLDSTSCHVDGRYNSDTPPDEQGVHMTRGSSRDHRPDLNQVMLELIVEHQAGSPVLMKPRRGNRRDAPAFGQIVREPMAQLQTTYGTTYLVADAALYSEDTLQTRANPQLKGITRVPATLHEAQSALAPAEPETMLAMTEGYRYHVLTSTDGGVEPRWVLISAEPRQPQATRTVDTQLLKQGDQAVKACKKLCGDTLAGEAEARQSLATFEPGLQATFLPKSTICPTPRYGKRGRPRQGAPPDHVVYAIEGALASQVAARQALIAQPSGFLLATNELDNTPLPPPALFEGDKGQAHAARGFRFLKDPGFLASSRYLKTPERIMALVMVMTVCLLVYAALAYRIRQALKDHGATFPNQQGKPVQNPTARWVFHDLVGIHLLLIPQQWPIVIHLTEEHQHLLPLLGDR